MNEIGFIAGGNFGIDKISNNIEIYFCEARVVAECKRVMKRQTLEEDHSQPEWVCLIEIEFSGSLSIIKIKLP